MRMNEQQKQVVLKLITEAKPATLLSVGPQARDFYQPYLAANPGCRLTRLAAADALTRLPRLGRFDFAFVAETLERLPKAEAAALIARLRDLHAARFVVVVPLVPRPDHESRWSNEELAAYGLTPVGPHREPDDAPALYGFDIAHYKQTPDWLNSKYWAHPERFDKYRW